MPTPPALLNKQNKVVVACLDGQRLKGYASNFSAIREYFRLFPAENSPHEAGTDVDFSTLKAIFFVKDFEGHREHHDAYDVKASTHGRKIEVTFQDGEKSSEPRKHTILRSWVSFYSPPIQSPTTLAYSW